MSSICKPTFESYTILTKRSQTNIPNFSIKNLSYFKCKIKYKMQKINSNETVSIPILFAHSAVSLGKAILRHFLLLGGLGKQF